MKHCSNCKYQDTNRGFCWCPERGADQEDPQGYVFSEVTQQTEKETTPEKEICECWKGID